MAAPACSRLAARWEAASADLVLGRDFLLDAELAERLRRIEGVASVSLSVVRTSTNLVDWRRLRLLSRWGGPMLGGMQDFELRVPRLIDHAEREHGHREIVTALGRRQPDQDQLGRHRARCEEACPSA